MTDKKKASVASIFAAFDTQASAREHERATTREREMAQIRDFDVLAAEAVVPAFEGIVQQILELKRKGVFGTITRRGPDLPNPSNYPSVKLEITVDVGRSLKVTYQCIHPRHTPKQQRSGDLETTVTIETPDLPERRFDVEIPLNSDDVQALVLRHLDEVMQPPRKQT